jgi:hypothetical protein
VCVCVCLCVCTSSHQKRANSLSDCPILLHLTCKHHLIITDLRNPTGFSNFRPTARRSAGAKVAQIYFFSISSAFINQKSFQISLENGSNHAAPFRQSSTSKMHLHRTQKLDRGNKRQKDRQTDRQTNAATAVDLSPLATTRYTHAIAMACCKPSPGSFLHPTPPCAPPGRPAGGWPHRPHT